MFAKQEILAFDEDQNVITYKQQHTTRLYHRENKHEKFLTTLFL